VVAVVKYVAARAEVLEVTLVPSLTGLHSIIFSRD
jgi:hypothetical protein